MSSRVDRVRAQIPEGCASMLVTDPVNVRYLTGFASSNAALLVDETRVVLLTDGRYVEAASSVPGVEVVEASRDLALDLGSRLGSLSSGPVAFEADHLSVARHARIVPSGVELVATSGVVEGVRAVKEAAEVDAIRRSAAILTGTYERLAGESVVGRTEAELVWFLEQAMHELGAEGAAFATIVASGPNAALPHHHPGERVVEADETLLVDAGCLVDGYCSDCTRTFATGVLPDEVLQAYSTCRSAQERSLAEVRAGADCREVDGVARGILTGAGYPVMHGLGHGVGLAIHEEPRLTDSATGTLVAGNVVTVEPGVYLAGIGGVRIEDLVVVTSEGVDVLTAFPKDLVTLH
jgi:Xaa-Pro aminopeptidase